jgi:DNA-directed RNA polymerase specialized sigma24 family protein
MGRLMTPGTHAFHTTRWTLVRSASGESPAARQALSELCATYYAPVVAFLRREGRHDDTARELAHEFFAKVLADDSLGGVERGRGRFRSYLLGAVKHFLANHRRDAAREKRGGGAEHIAIRETTDTTPGIEVADSSALAVSAQFEAAFDREWALDIVERSLALLESQSASAGQSAQFDALKPWLSPGASCDSQAVTAAQLSLSEGALKVAIHRLRRRFRDIVRAEIAQTLHDTADLDDEMRHLVEALAE